MRWCPPVGSPWRFRSRCWRRLWGSPSRPGRRLPRRRWRPSRWKDENPTKSSILRGPLMGELAAPATSVPIHARPKLRAWLRLIGVVAIPLAAGALAMLLAQLVGVTGRGRSATFYGVQLVAAIVVAQRTFGLRTIGLGRLPGPAAMGWPAALVGVRLVPWLLFIPVQGWTHDPMLLLTALVYFLLFNAAAEEVLFRGLLLQGIRG